jgi:hypothetical protein
MRWISLGMDFTWISQIVYLALVHYFICLKIIFFITFISKATRFIRVLLQFKSFIFVTLKIIFK